VSGAPLSHAPPLRVDAPWSFLYRRMSGSAIAAHRYQLFRSLRCRLISDLWSFVSRSHSLISSRVLRQTMQCVLSGEILHRLLQGLRSSQIIGSPLDAGEGSTGHRCRPPLPAVSGIAVFERPSNSHPTPRLSVHGQRVALPPLRLSRYRVDQPLILSRV